MRRTLLLALALTGAGSAIGNRSPLEKLTDNNQLKFDVQPHNVKKSELRIDPFRSVSGLKVLVSNPLDRPLVYGFGCSGFVPVLVKDAEAQQNKLLGYGTVGSNETMIAYTSELRTRIIQPGETVEFPSFRWVNLAKLEPGRSVWVISSDVPAVPFDLVP